MQALSPSLARNWRCLPSLLQKVSTSSILRPDPASCGAVYSSDASSGTAVVPRIVFLGPPGVGKGTYAKRISKWLNVPHIAAGDLLRKEVKDGTALGKEVESIVEKGGLVPDETILKLLKQFLRDTVASPAAAGVEVGDQDSSQVLHGRHVKSTGGYILDGFPRTVRQAELLSEFEDVNLVLNLFLREDVLIEKCLGRRICTKCNGNYNVADIYRAPDEANGKPEIGELSRCPCSVIARWRCFGSCAFQIEDPRPMEHSRLSSY